MTTKANNSTKNGPSRFRKDAKAFSPSYLQTPVNYDLGQHPVPIPPQMPMSPMNTNIPNYPMNMNMNMNMNMMPFPGGNGPMMAMNPNQNRFDYSSVYGQQQYPFMYQPQHDYNPYYQAVPPPFGYYSQQQYMDVPNGNAPPKQSKYKKVDEENKENAVQQDQESITKSDPIPEPENQPEKAISEKIESPVPEPKSESPESEIHEPSVEPSVEPESSFSESVSDSELYLHSPIFINSNSKDISSAEIGTRKSAFENKSYDQISDIVISPFKYAIINYNEESKQNEKVNWASVLTKTSHKRTKSKVVAKDMTVPAIKPIAKDEKEEIDTIGKLGLKIMFDPEFSVIDSPNNDFYKVNPRGLTNTGNICYMNSILQVLIYCEPFNRLVKLLETKSIGTLDIKNSTTPLINALISLFHDFTQPNLKSLSPESFYMKLIGNRKFQHLKWGQQEDAEEFLGYLLDGLHEEFVDNIKLMKPAEIEGLINKYEGEIQLNLKQAIKIIRKDEDLTETIKSNGSTTENDEWNEVGKKNEPISSKRTVEIEPSPIKTIFGGQFRSVLKIPHTKTNQSITLDPYQCIQLDIKEDSITTIEEAFKHLNVPEQIQFKSGEQDVIAKKQTFIDNLPPVLVIHLKRFSFQQQGNIEKITKKIKYDFNLTIPVELFSSYKRSSIQNNYKLIGVVYHHGVSAEGGHYTCDVLKKSKLSNILVDNDSSSNGYSGSNGYSNGYSNGSGNNNINGNDNDEWIRIDDTLINKIDNAEVVEANDEIKNAYILFYQKL